MNLSLLDPFSLAQDHPDSLLHTIKWGHSNCIRFSNSGNYLASGLLDGPVIVIDCDTTTVLRVLKRHSRTVQSVSWSADDRYLLSSSLDYLCILWDLKDGSIKKLVNFDAPCWTAMLSPQDPDSFVVSLYESEAKASRGSEEPRPIVYDVPAKTIYICYDDSGDHIVTGTSNGMVYLLDPHSLEIAKSTRVGKSSITSIRFGKSVVSVNSSDRVVRLLSYPELEVLQTYKDAVNRRHWNMSIVTKSDEYTLATQNQTHDMYMWENSQGQLVKIYQGAKDELGDIDFHPTKPIIVANGADTGLIHWWGLQFKQQWSALAPDYEELDESIAYEEREDDYDLDAMERMLQKKAPEEVSEVDIHTREFQGQVEPFMMPIMLNLDIEPPKSPEKER